MNKNVLQLKNISKSYMQGGGRIEILKNASMEVNAGDILAVIGSSGCGKSTLLHICGTVDKPDDGEVIIDSQNILTLSDRQKASFRNGKIGFVYQFHYLLPEFTALENVMLPLIIAGVNKKEASEKAAELLRLFGLSERVNHRPSELSGGEQQRVAICRAVIAKPKLLLADEPTGNLDPKNAEVVFNNLISYAKKEGLALVLVTHNHELAAKADKRITIEAGQIKNLP